MLKYLLIFLMVFNIYPKEKGGKKKMEELKGKKILMIIASQNFRDEEYLKPKSIFIKSGANVTTASSKLGELKGMLGAKVKPDILIDKVNPLEFDAIVLVGGIGATEYFDNKTVHNIFQTAVKNNKIIAAICISPATLANAGVLKGKKATVFSSEKEALISGGANYVDVPVVKDGKVITARDPNAADEFGQTIKKALLEK